MENVGTPWNAQKANGQGEASIRKRDWKTGENRSAWFVDFADANGVLQRPFPFGRLSCPYYCPKMNYL